MPRNTINSGESASNTQTATNTSQSRRRNAPKHVSFEDNQGNAAVTAAITAADKAKQKKEQEKAKMAQAKANAMAAKKELQQQQAAMKKELQQQQAAMKRREQEEARRRKDEALRVARLEEEINTLRRDKDLELERLRAAAAQRQEDERIAIERRARQTSEEMRDEIDLPMPDSPRTVAAEKRDLEWRKGPHEYSLRAVLRAQNGSQTQCKWNNKIGGLWKKGNFDINALNLEIDSAMEDNGLSELSEIRGWVKSTAGRGTRQPFNMSSLSIDQWEQRVESITAQEWYKHTGHIIDVEVTCTARAVLRRGIQAVDGAAQSPSHRRTRTNRLEEQNAVVRDRNEALGERGEQLITRWKCQSTSCGHSGTCWVDETGEHHRLNAIMRERWATAIIHHQATEFEPPVGVYKALMGQGPGSSTQSSQKGRSKPVMEQMKELLTQQMEFSMMKSMRSMANDDTQQSQQPQQQPQHYYAPPPPPSMFPPWATSHYLPPHGGYLQPSHVAPTQSPSPTPAPRNQDIPERAERAQAAPEIATTPLRSSPIGRSSEEDDIIEAFWQWKKESTTKPSRKLQIGQASAIIDDEMWGLDDMKAMADTSSEVYKRAIDAGLPDGLIRGLKGDLKEFKGLWRNTIQPARTLETLGQQGIGGFM